jgi:branched-chain amino acid transport system ATP-binding protein
MSLVNASSDPPLVLEVRGLTKRFGGLTAVDNVSFGLAEGSILGLIGPNGAGKTTLFNMLSGVYRPQKGRVTFRGEDITGLPPADICARGIGRTFQITKPFGSLSVVDNVMVGAFLRTNSVRQAREESWAVCRTVGLEARGKLAAKNLTIADRKRLELARALATRPRLLLLDEVMAGLNPSEIEEIMALLKRINALGITLLIIEHVMAAVMRLSHTIVVTANGRKIAEGPPERIARDEAVIQAYLGEEYQFAPGAGH